MADESPNPAAPKRKAPAPDYPHEARAPAQTHNPSRKDRPLQRHALLHGAPVDDQKNPADVASPFVACSQSAVVPEPAPEPTAPTPESAPIKPARKPAPTTPGLAIVLIAITILICIAAAMRLDRPVVRDRTAPAAAAQLELRINLNTATEAELQLLPLIGPALAERIVDDREANGRFAALEDLARVRGIGSTIIERIAPYATVEH